ncbi:hypothetical protein PR048_003862 [Dryococelus australis]|uniref:Uncharacterized protein n=1 Tax=Dryococelus australis TaxID=614101 RepID=A0ABQ9IPE8_9NEOP|nr:hypothetical protein PR048_003862 [Dryococelus australis]
MKHIPTTLAIEVTPVTRPSNSIDGEFYSDSEEVVRPVISDNIMANVGETADQSQENLGINSELIAISLPSVSLHSLGTTVAGLKENQKARANTLDTVQNNLIQKQSLVETKLVSLRENLTEIQTNVNGIQTQVQSIEIYIVSEVEHTRLDIENLMTALDTRISTVENTPPTPSASFSSNILKDVDNQLINFERHIEAKFHKTATECFNSQKDLSLRNNELQSKLVELYARVIKITLTEVTTSGTMEESVHQIPSRDTQEPSSCNHVDYAVSLSPDNLTATILHHPAKQWSEGLPTFSEEKKQREPEVEHSFLHEYWNTRIQGNLRARPHLERFDPKKSMSLEQHHDEMFERTRHLDAPMCDDELAEVIVSPLPLRYRDLWADRSFTNLNEFRSQILKID